MGVKNSGTRSGFLIYSYLKTGVYLQQLFPFARFSQFFLGEYVT